jgi:hypothetical protein
MNSNKRLAGRRFAYRACLLYTASMYHHSWVPGCGILSSDPDRTRELIHSEWESFNGGYSWQGSGLG